MISELSSRTSPERRTERRKRLLKVNGSEQNMRRVRLFLYSNRLQMAQRSEELISSNFIVNYVKPIKEGIEQREFRIVFA